MPQDRRVCTCDRRDPRRSGPQCLPRRHRGDRITAGPGCECARAVCRRRKRGNARRIRYRCRRSRLARGRHGRPARSPDSCRDLAARRRAGVAMSDIALTVNGKAVIGSVEPRTNLADFIRDRLNLTGTHLGCEHGVCGGCTVLIEGVAARSCITYALACEGAEVTTIEGLDDDEIARELRAAFTREHALQCGYCTPGMLVSARDLVLRLPQADEQQIRVAMSGNLCRCTGYVGIVRAVQSVIEQRRARHIAPEPDGGRKV